MQYSTRTSCRVCGSSDLQFLFGLGDHYVNAFPEPGYDPEAYPRCPLELELCGNCSLVQLKHTAPQELLYSKHYWYRSGATETMRSALRDITAAAEELVDLQPGDVVLDIGSNDGTLLRSYTKEGIIRVGVEPAANMRGYYKDTDYLHSGFWGVGDGTPEDFLMCHGQAKIITAAGMFYDLEFPNEFIADVAKALHPEGLFIAQLMCLKNMLSIGDVGNVCHEHLEYYSLFSLAKLLRQNGLNIYDIETNNVNGESYRLYIEHVGRHVECTDRVDKAFRDEKEMGLWGVPDIANRLKSYFNKWDYQRRVIKGTIEGLVRRDKKVFVYGASTKGNSLLQYWGLDSELISGAADSNPDKHGKVTIGTDIPIMSHEDARKEMPDFYLVLPYSFRSEFLEIEKDQEWRKRGGRFIFPLPELEIV